MNTYQRTEWLETWILIGELWPRWEATDPQQQEWERRLGWRVQAPVREAVRELYGEKTVLAPRMGWILTKLLGGVSVAPRRSRWMTPDENPRQAEREMAEMRADLRELPELRLLVLLQTALERLAVWMLAGMGPARSGARTQLRGRAESLGLDPDKWGPDIVGFAWAASREAAEGREWLESRGRSS